MFTLSSSQKYYLYTSIADMRNGINGLSGLVNACQKRGGNQNEVFVFINRHKNIMKLLFYEYSGQSIFYKRLEKGCYEHRVLDQGFLAIKWSDLVSRMSEKFTYGLMKGVLIVHLQLLSL